VACILYTSKFLYSEVFSLRAVELLLVLYLVCRWGWVVSITPRPRFTPGTHCTGGWVGLTTKNFLPLSGSNRSRPVRSQTLYRLSYSHINTVIYFPQRTYWNRRGSTTAGNWTSDVLTFLLRITSRICRLSCMPDFLWNTVYTSVVSDYRLSSWDRYLLRTYEILVTGCASYLGPSFSLGGGGGIKQRFIFQVPVLFLSWKLL
jgi:hypothetical protein